MGLQEKDEAADDRALKEELTEQEGHLVAVSGGGKEVPRERKGHLTIRSSGWVGSGAARTFLVQLQVNRRSANDATQSDGNLVAHLSALV